MPAWFSGLMDQPLIYSLFHGVVSGKKSWHLRRELARDTTVTPLRVIDVGCGPGTNAHLFKDRARFDYLGVDINPDYIEKARRKHGLAFECVDITAGWKPETQFDVVLINSVLHHIPDELTAALLKACAQCMESSGRCLVMDMVYPREKTIFNAHRRMLIGMDRGEFCRTEEKLEAALLANFKFRRVEKFFLRLFFVPLWDMRLYVCEKK